MRAGCTRPWSPCTSSSTTHRRLRPPTPPSAGAPAGLLASRQWADEDIAGARTRLLARGWIDSRGALTVSGQAARQEIELHTDELAMAPWEAIGTDGCDRLHSLLAPLAAAVDPSRL